MNWEQLKTVLWLRWRLTRNQWIRGGNLGAVIAGLLLAVGLVTAIGLFGGAIALGLFGLRATPSSSILLTWNIVVGFFLVTWLIGLLTELQRSETIDLPRLMHLPVRLGQIFTLNYIASHFVLSLVLVTPVMAGLSIGLAIGRAPAMLLLLPLSAGTVLMITAWTYCLRGWLATLLANPRRRRSAIVLVSMVLMLVAQGPNIYFNLLKSRFQPPARRAEPQPQHQREQRMAQQQRDAKTMVAAQRFVPPFWLPLAAKSIAENNPWPALGATAGCFLIAAAGLYRAYQGTVRFYRGDTVKQAAAGGRMQTAGSDPSLAAARRPATKGSLLEQTVRGVPGEASAVALATFLSMLRAPEVRMQWAMTVMMVIVFCAMALRRTVSAVGVMKPFILTGLTTMMLFMLIQGMANQFGFDRGGFRAMVLAPVDRRNVLLGKNLANLPVPTVLAVLLIAVGTAWLHVPVLAAMIVLLQFITMFVLASTLGNLLSILVPYRIRAGSMKPTKLPAKAQLVMFGTHMLFPAIMTPAVLPSVAQAVWDWLKWPPFSIGLVLAALLLGGASAIYWTTLGPLARLLQQREMRVVDLLGTEVE